MYSKWVQSWRDLPILINQWANVVRWEKRPRLFLRTSEFLWQEGHTAHASREEAMEETLKMLEVYRKIMVEKLALPVVVGEKSEGERFPGADNTFTCETMMSDKKALQAGTSHYLGQNFAKAFDISFQNREGEMEFAYTTSWGVSTRLIGALIMTHADNDGLILPPRIAPVKAVIVPISTDETRLDEELLPKARALAELLNIHLGSRAVTVDTQFHLRPGDRFFSHLQKGVPLRLELGEKEMEKGTVRVVRRDTGEKLDLSWDALAAQIPAILEDIQEQLYRNALNFRLENNTTVTSLNDFKEVMENRGGFVKAFFAGSGEDEKVIKEIGGVTVRCFPLEDKETGKCFFTGREGARMAILAKAY